MRSPYTPHDSFGLDLRLFLPIAFGFELCLKFRLKLRLDSSFLIGSRLLGSFLSSKFVSRLLSCQFFSLCSRSLRL
jgi:hypothetical protein